MRSCQYFVLIEKPTTEVGFLFIDYIILYYLLKYNPFGLNPKAQSHWQGACREDR
jgi:hypothetical protein